MCIRDSSKGRAVLKFRVDRPDWGRFGVRVTDPASGHASACLLYTSDAADERSSVDLGGRRIIKTKKREMTGGRHDAKARIHDKQVE